MAPFEAKAAAEAIAMDFILSCGSHEEEKEG